MTTTGFRRAATLVVGVLFLLAIAAVASSKPGERKPAVLERADLAGAIFDRGDVVRTEHDNGNVTLDVTSLESSDGRFASGVYRSGSVQIEIDQPYGVDEFMYFLEGGVTLTSTDGSVQEIGAGEAVTIPKEWTGTWTTSGYTKIWVIYSEDGSGLQAAAVVEGGE